MKVCCPAKPKESERYKEAGEHRGRETKLWFVFSALLLPKTHSQTIRNQGIGEETNCRANTDSQIRKSNVAG